MRYSNAFTVETGVSYHLEFSKDGLRLFDERNGNYFWPKTDKPDAWYEAIGLMIETTASGEKALGLKQKKVNAND
jgi:hypothetical protein